jgi:hypothetical protein
VAGGRGDGYGERDLVDALHRHARLSLPITLAYNIPTTIRPTPNSSMQQRTTP